MQDTRSGEMVPVPKDIYDDVKLISNKLEKEYKIRQGMKPIIPRKHQGPILEVGELLTIKGGKFKVHAITQNRVYLTPLPGK